MTVQTNNNSISYVGNGSTVHFDYDFSILDASHLKVYFGDALQTSGYVVSGVSSQTGGTVAFAVAPPNGTNIILIREVPFLQLTDYQPYDAFPAESHERALDLLTMMAQQLKDELGRTMQYPVGSNKLDAKGNEIINVGTGSNGTSAANINQVKHLIASEVGDDPSASASVRAREALRRSYAEAGYNLVDGSFEAGGTLVKTSDVLLQESTGKAFTGPAGPVAVGTNPASGGFVDRSVVGVAFTSAEVQAKLDAGFKVVQAFVKTITSAISIPRNATVVFNDTTRIALNGNVFTIITGARVYGDFIVNAGFNPTIGYVDGTFRPTMLLADNRRAGIYGTIRSESATPHGRALFLDGNARNGKLGIISWFECDLTLRNVQRACDVEVSNPDYLDGRKSYVNNNYLRIAMWGVPYGYIEADVDTTKAEIAANDIHLDYQSSAVSVQIVRNRGTRNNLRGNIWDTSTSAYPSLLSNAVDIGGRANTVGGANWPSPTSNVVSITDTLCNYTGYGYGTAKTVINPLTVLSRLGVDHGNGVEGAIFGQLGAISNPVSIPAGAVLQSVFSRTYGFNSNRAPYFIDGYILLKNPTLSPVNVQVKFGPTSSDGALSTTFQVAAQTVKRVDLSLMISALRQNATCGDRSWYGTIDYSSLSKHEVHVQITSAEGVTVDGLVLRRSSEL